jgi:PhnB protein
MVHAIPEGVGNVVPYLCIRGAKKAIEFYQAAFGAEVLSVMPMGDLVGHADLKIGASRVYLADEMPRFGALKSPVSLKGTTANIHLWVEDCDAAFARATAAGAVVLMPLTDQFWGDRYGMVKDPFGHVWAITSHKEDLTPEEMMRRGDEALAQMAASAPPSAPKPKAKAKAKRKGLPKPAAKAAAKPKEAAPAAKVKAEPAPKAAKAKAKVKKKVKKVKKPKKDKKDKKSKLAKKAKKDKKRKKKSKR